MAAVGRVRVALVGTFLSVVVLILATLAPVAIGTRQHIKRYAALGTVCGLPAMRLIDLVCGKASARCHVVSLRRPKQARAKSRAATGRDDRRAIFEYFCCKEPSA